MTTFTLLARPPFNFRSVVNSHGWRQLAPFDYDENTSTLSYVFRAANGRVMQINMHGVKTGVTVDVKGRLSKLESNEVKEAVTWMFALDADYSSFYKIARKEPRLRKAIKFAYGRVLRSPTLFEDVIKTLFTTNTLWGATRSMTKKLVASFGDPLPGSELKAFPTAERIAASSPEALREEIRVGYRAPALHQLAVRVASGELDLESLKTSSLPSTELRKEFMKLNGIGPYAAANLLLIMGRSDYIPVDTGALTAVSREWHGGKPVTEKEVQKAFEEWDEFKGFAYWFWDWEQMEG